MEQEQGALCSEHKTKIQFHLLQAEYACESSLEERSALNLHQSRAEHHSVLQSSQVKIWPQKAWPDTAKQLPKQAQIILYY